MLSALCGRWRYALRGIIAYALICTFTVWCMGVLHGIWRAMFVAFLGLVHKVYACGLHMETSGSYFWNGKPQKPRERMKRAYMVMQDVNYQLFAESVESECTFGIKHPDKELAEKALIELGLAPFRERHPNTLSGGQKQRLAAAASMACGKELLVFDEPTSGLDYDSMARLAALIQKLSAMCKVIFIVTHDYEFVCRTCRRVLHLDGGGVRDDLTVSEENIQRIKELFDVR